MAGRANFGQISESDYSNLLQALSSTTKGRLFLTEYRRHSQPQDMLGLLDSLKRIEETMAGVRDQLRPERIADELLNVAMTLELATEGAAADPEGDEAARRMALVKRARCELTALAASLGREIAPTPQEPDGPHDLDTPQEPDLGKDSARQEPDTRPPIRLIADEGVFLRELGLDRQDIPVER